MSSAIDSGQLRPAEAVIFCLWLSHGLFMLTKDQKKEIVKELIDKLSRQKSVVFFDCTGLTVNQFQELRSQLRKENIDCQVGKKTLINLALEKAGLSKKIKVKELSGQVALSIGYEDEIAPSKILYNFSRKNENVKILAGLINGDYLDADAVISLAKLPSKQELVAKLIGNISSPLYGLTNVLEGNLRKLLFIFQSIKAEA